MRMRGRARNGGRRMLAFGSGGDPVPPSSPVPDVWLKPENYTAGTWTDVGTLGFSPVQADGPTQPTLLADSGFKGRPGVQFSATQNLVGAGDLAQSRAKGTLICAFRLDGQSSGGIFSTTQEQLGIINGSSGGFLAALNVAASEYGAFTINSLTGGQLVTLIYDGTLSSNANRLKLFRNLVQETLSFTGTIPATTFAGGTGIYLGRQAAGGGTAQVQVANIFFRDVALTTPQRVAWETYVAALYFTKTTSGLVASGDSITLGSLSQTANPWPLRVKTAMGWTGYQNSAQNGQSAATMYGSRISLLLQYRDDWYTHQVAMIMGGSNDLVAGTAVATIEGYLSGWVTAAKADRFPALVHTILPSVNFDATMETNRQTINAWIVAGSSGADFVVDGAADARLSNFADLTYYEDGTHPTNAGQQVLADLTVAQLRAGGY